MNRAILLMPALFLLACGDVVPSVVDAGKDAAPDVSDASRLFCSPAYGEIDASAPNPPAIYECTRPGDRCWIGPNGSFVCCRPDSSDDCFQP